MGAINKLYRLFERFLCFSSEAPLLIVESDDWGSIRTHDVKTKKHLLTLKNEFSKDPFLQFDNLASSEELSVLCENLNSVKDKTGRPACITANFYIANPDFQKIKSDYFEKFHYEPLLKKRRQNLQATLDIYELSAEVEIQKKWISDNTSMFKDYFGFSSKTFKPHAYTWNSQIDDNLKETGMEAKQGFKLQYEPAGGGNKKYRKRVHYTGQERNNICYLTRNCIFEASIFPGTDLYSETMSGIETAFRNQQPAIIGNHRINFIGNLE